MGEEKSFSTTDGSEYNEEFPEKEFTPERKRIKKSLSVIVPEGLILTKKGFEDALRKIIGQKQKSIQELMESGIDYTGRMEYPTPIFIRIERIVGTEPKAGWSGLIEGFGEKIQSRRRVQNIDEVFGYAEQITKMKQDEKDAFVNDIEIAEYNGNFFVDSNGRHRILTLKALGELGCDVTLSGFRVSILAKT